jgi:hypothetical protein
MKTTIIKSVSRVVLMGALCAGGAFLIYDGIGYAQDTRTAHHYEEYRKEWSLKAIALPLPAIERALRAYAERHGQYPTNDEGLAVLVDLFDTRIVLAHDGPWQDGWGWHEWDDINGATEHLFMAMERHTAGELDAAGSCIGPTDERRSYYPTCTLELDGDREYTFIWQGEPGNLTCFFLADEAGLYSPSAQPYFYENRRGLDAQAFAHSPANTDTERRYSVTVDDGIFVYAPEGQYLLPTPHPLMLRTWAEFGVGGLCLAGAVGLVFWPKTGLAFLLCRIVALIVFGYLSMRLDPRIMCYEQAGISLFYSRDPEIVARQKELLDEYHARGVINGETYARLVRAAADGPGQPVSTDESAPTDE